MRNITLKEKEEESKQNKKGDTEIQGESKRNRKKGPKKKVTALWANNGSIPSSGNLVLALQINCEFLHNTESHFEEFLSLVGIFRCLGALT